MKRQLILATIGAIALSGCSSMNPWSANRMVELDKIEAEDGFKVPKYITEPQDDDIGVGIGRATDPEASINMATHYAIVDLCRKLSQEAQSKTRSTATQNSKGGSSLTSVTGAIVSETSCSAKVGTPKELNKDMFQKGNEFVTFVRLESSNVQQSLTNQFSSADQNVADSLDVN